MKGLAFAKDPDGYWIEVISRSPQHPSMDEYYLAQTMLRIKDPVKSIKFYRDILGMSLLKETHFGPGSGDFSLYFLAQIPPGEPIPDPTAGVGDYISKMPYQVIELTHNHGTENDSDFAYHDGNLQDKEKGILQGFGHTGFIVDDLHAACNYLTEQGVPFKKRPEEGGMKTLAFVYDPDGYAVEIIQKDCAFL
jgi:lactoylglutathione lyase